MQDIEKKNRNEEYLNHQFIKYYDVDGNVSLTGVSVNLNRAEIQNRKIPPFFSIPSSITSRVGNQLPVVAVIWDYFAEGFAGCPAIFGISIPNSIKVIGEQAFESCKNLVYVSLGEEVYCIKRSAFENCKNLNQIKLPRSLRVLDAEAFAYSGIKEITIHREIVYVGFRCFCKCPLERIIIEDPNTYIDKYAFEGCDVKSIIAPIQMAGRLYEIFRGQLENMSIRWIDCGPERISPPVRFDDISVEHERYGDGTFGWTLRYEAKNLCYTNIELSVDRPFFLTRDGARIFDYDLSGRTVDEEKLIPSQAIEGASIISDDKASEDLFSEWCKICVPYSVEKEGITEEEKERIAAQFYYSNYPPIQPFDYLQHVQRGYYTTILTQFDDKWCYFNGEEHICEAPVIKEILVADFVVKSNIFRCNSNHNIETINATIRLMTPKGETIQAHITAGYCSECDCYFILKRDFESISRKGILLCRLLEEEEYHTKGQAIMFGNEMQDQSLLRRCGYTVNAKDNLTADQRRGILRYVVDEGLYSVSQICSFLDWLMDINSRGWQNKTDAILKWRSDREYISKYGELNRKSIGVNSIRYKK